MFETIFSFYRENNESLNSIAATLTIVGAVWGLAQYWKSRKQKIFFDWNRSKRVTSSAPAGYEISVQFGDKSGNGLTTDTVVISNRTKVTLADDDFVKPISFKRIPGRTIYEAEILQMANGTAAELEFRDDHIELKKLHIPREKALAIYFAHDDAIHDQLTCTPKTLPDLRNKKFRAPQETVPAALISLFIILGGLSFFAGFIERFLIGMEPIIWQLGSISLLAIGTLLILSIVVRVFLPKILDLTLGPIIGITHDELMLSRNHIRQLIETTIYAQRRDHADNPQFSDKGSERRSAG